MFGSDHYGMKLDLITIAKGLISAYAPLSGVSASEMLWRILEQGSDTCGPIGHGWTYSSHPLCATAGVTNLEVVDKLDLVANSREVGGYHEGAERHRGLEPLRRRGAWRDRPGLVARRYPEFRATAVPDSERSQHGGGRHLIAVSLTLAVQLKFHSVARYGFSLIIPDREGSRPRTLWEGMFQC
jgi:hypothetical protein